MLKITVVCASVALGLAAEPVPPQERSRVVTVLRTAGLGEPELRALGAGQAVARVLPGVEAGELVTVGAVRVEAPPSLASALVRELTDLADGEEVLAAGRFQSPPRFSDLPMAVLPARDLERLGRPDEPRLLPVARATEPARAAVEWRDRLVELASRYHGAGAAALDGRNGATHAATLTRLWRRSAPLLAAAGLESPTPGTPQVEDTLTWSLERVWHERPLRLWRKVVSAPDRGPVTLAVEQIYASHYFDGALRVIAYVPASGERGDILEITRTLTDVGPEGFSWLERLLVRRFASRSVERRLLAIRDRLAAATRKLQAAR